MARTAATNRLSLKNIRSSVSFNGTTTNVAYSGVGITGFSSACSFSGWAYIASGSTTSRISMARWGDGSSPRCSICFQQSSLGKEDYSLQSGYWNGTAYTLGGIARVPVNSWFHVGFTWDGTTAEAYINGVLTTGTSGSPASGSTTGLNLGNQGGAFWIGNQSNAKLWTRVLTQDEMTALSLLQDDTVNTSGLWLNWAMDDGAGTIVTDYSGNSRPGTITSGSFTYNSPSKARKLINGNMVRNGDFEYAPPFTAVQTAGSTWMDGSAAGSSTNDLFGWAVVRNATSIEARFDPTTVYSGSYSLKLSTLDATGRVLVRPLASATAANILKYGIPVTPNTSYMVSARIKTNNVAATTAGNWVRYDATGTAIGSDFSVWTGNSSTQDWTMKQTIVTTGSTDRFMYLQLVICNTAGNISDAWYDEVSVTPVYPEGRVPANGNLVKNFDFEVAPTFVATQTTRQRYLDGSAAGSLTNQTYKWAINGTNSTSTNMSAQFDSSVFYSGAYSMKVSLTGTNAAIAVSNVLTSSQADVEAGAIRILANTSYTYRVRMKTNYVSGDSSDGAYFQLTERTGTGSAVQSTITAKVKTTTDWTEYTGTFTTAATSIWLTPLLFVVGNTGAATLIMDAWFDDIYLAKTTNPGRVTIT